MEGDAVQRLACGVYIGWGLMHEGLRSHSITAISFNTLFSAVITTFVRNYDR